jgi:hypothetical protein
LGPEPSYFAVAGHPFVYGGLIFEAGDVSNFSAGTVSLDLPVAFRNAVWMKNNTGRFGHVASMSGQASNMPRSGLVR